LVGCIGLTGIRWQTLNLIMHNLENGPCIF
jgi:hypothetical protein